MSDVLLLVVVAIPLLVGVVGAVAEAVRRPDLGSARRAVWVVALLLVPVAGLAWYVLVRPPKKLSVTVGSGGSGAAERIVDAAERRHRGEIGPTEYRAEIAQLIGVSDGPSDSG